MCVSLTHLTIIWMSVSFISMSTTTSRLGMEEIYVNMISIMRRMVMVMEHTGGGGGGDGSIVSTLH